MNLHSDTLKIGMKINIEIINEAEENNKANYPSQILDILEFDEFVIRGPIKRRNLIFLHKNDRIYITYNILDKGMHYFEGIVLSRNYTDIYTLKIKKTSEISNLQNREYYRLSTTISVIKEFVINKSDEEIYVEKCETKDISGGGIRLYSNYKHKIGDYLVCFFTILNHQIAVKCRVIRLDETDSFNYKYSLGLSFLNIDESYRDIIIRYIFNQQRKLRSKGLI